MTYDFGGWATKANMRCADGLIIAKDAFKECDGKTVPLVWNHQHKEAKNVLGHALLENREDGVYVRATFNNTEEGKRAKSLVEHGDITSLSIYANQLKKNANLVEHGLIREVSLVLAGCNPGAFIDNVITHGDHMEAIVYNDADDGLFLCHSDEADKETAQKDDTKKEEKLVAEENKNEAKETTVQDVIDSMNEDQKNVMYYLVGQAMDQKEESDDEEEEDIEVKHNAFEDYNGSAYTGSFLSHADEENILQMCKTNKVVSFKQVLADYVEDEAIAHGIDADEIGKLFPEPELLTKGEPELLRDAPTDWVGLFFNGITKSPYARVRTRHVDARKREIEARGYKKGDKKVKRADMKLLGRVTDPQTIYITDQVHRDDVLDIQDFNYIGFIQKNMMDDLQEDIATAVFIGDGRDDTDANKIHEDHIRPIYTDDDLYVIRRDVDFAAMKAELNGTDTGKHFGDNYIKAEAIVEASRYAQEDYRSKKGTPDLFATPHMINQMMLARDLNGRRLYNTRAELAAALNVNRIIEVKKFDNVERTDKTGKKHKLLGFILNLADYQIGAVKDGQITSFDDFDIDFNTYKYLIETRCSGALIEPFSAIVLEEPVVTEAGEIETE